MAFRPMHDALPAESGAAQLMGALEIERRLYLQLFNTLPTPGLVLTADGEILEANPEGAKLLGGPDAPTVRGRSQDRKSTRLNSSHSQISYAVFCLKKTKSHFPPAAAPHKKTR